MKFSIRAVLLASVAASGHIVAQNVPPPPAGARGVGAEGAQAAAIIYQPPPPVTVDGKKAADLTEDEMKEFLSSKIQNITQAEGEVELLKIAPGYALTMVFSEPVSSVIIGDPGLLHFTDKGRVIVLGAATRAGDTSMQVILPGDRVLNYHVFIAANYSTAQSTVNITVAPSKTGGDSGGQSSPYFSPTAGLDIPAIASVISNYDALLKEGAVSKSGVKKLPIYKKSDITTFQYYYIYVFKKGPMAITFSYTNPSSGRVTCNESRLRLQMGNLYFVPDYVSFDKTDLGPGETTTGFLVVSQPAFVPTQPFEIIWR